MAVFPLCKMVFPTFSPQVGARVKLIKRVTLQKVTKSVSVSNRSHSCPIHWSYTARRDLSIKTSTYHNHYNNYYMISDARNVMAMRNYSVGGAKTVTCEKCTHVYNNNATNDADAIVIFKFVKMVLCPKCGALQRIRSLPNYFEILGQDHYSYRVNVHEMSNRAKQLQKKFHPDLYSQKGNDQQQLSQEYSSLINKALSTLSDPVSRGRYMLTISGSTWEDNLEKNITKNPEFLEEVMELNERLEEITSEIDWKEFRSQNVGTMEQIQLDLEKAFERKDMQKAQRLLGRLKYYDTIQNKLKELQSEIGIIE